MEPNKKAKAHAAALASSEQLNSIEESARKIKIWNSELLAVTTDTEIQLEEMSKQYTELKQIQLELNLDREKLKIKISELNDLAHAWKEKHDCEVSDAAGLAEKLKNVEYENKHLKSTIEQNENKIDTLVSRLNSFESVRAGYVHDLTSLKEQANTYQAQISLLLGHEENAHKYQAAAKKILAFEAELLDKANQEKNLIAQIRVLNEKCSELVNSNQKLKGEFVGEAALLRSNIGVLENQVQNLTLRLNQELRALDEVKEKLITERSKSEAETRQLSERLLASGTEIQSLQNKLAAQRESFKVELEIYRYKLATQEAWIAQEKEKIKNFWMNPEKEMNTKVEELSQSLADSRIKISKVEAELVSAIHKNKLLEQSLFRIQDQNSELIRQSDEYKERFISAAENHQLEAKELAAEITKIKDHNQTLSGQISESDKVIVSLKAELKFKAGIAEDLQNSRAKIAELKAEIEKILLQKQELDAMLIMSNSELRALRGDLVRSESALEKNSLLSEQALKKNEELISENKKLQRDGYDVERRLDSVTIAAKHEVSKLQEKIESLEKQYVDSSARAHAEHESLVTRMNDGFMRERAVLEQTIATLQVDATKLSALAAHRELKVEGLIRDNKTLRLETQELQRRVESISKQNESEVSTAQAKLSRMEADYKKSLLEAKAEYVSRLERLEAEHLRDKAIAASSLQALHAEFTKLSDLLVQKDERIKALSEANANGETESFKLRHRLDFADEEKSRIAAELNQRMLQLREQCEMEKKQIRYDLDRVIGSLSQKFEQEKRAFDQTIKTVEAGLVNELASEKHDLQRKINDLKEELKSEQEISSHLKDKLTQARSAMLQTHAEHGNFEHSTIKQSAKNAGEDASKLTLASARSFKVVENE